MFHCDSDVARAITSMEEVIAPESHTLRCNQLGLEVGESSIPELLVGLATRPLTVSRTPTVLNTRPSQQQ